MYDKAYTFDFEGYKKAAASAYADEVAEVLAGRRYIEIMGDKYRDEARAGMERVTRELAADIITALNTTDTGCNIA